MSNTKMPALLCTKEGLKRWDKCSPQRMGQGLTPDYETEQTVSPFLTKHNKRETRPRNCALLCVTYVYVYAQTPHCPDLHAVIVWPILARASHIKNISPALGQSPLESSKFRLTERGTRTQLQYLHPA